MAKHFTSYAPISCKGLMRFIGLLFVLWFSTVSQAAESQYRIISLSPHLTEMTFSAGAGQDLVGVDSHSNYPAVAADLPKVGDAFFLNIERIVALKPDLVLAWQASIKPKDLQRLKTLGFKVFVSNIQKLDDIPAEIEKIGTLAGTQKIAMQTATMLRQKLSSIKEKYKHKQLVRYFYEVWNHPLTTINGQQFISQGLALCGGQNVFANLIPIAPQVNRESILAKNPQLILMGGQASNQKVWHQEWTQFPMLQAVKHHQILGVNSDLYQRPTARFIEALPHLCKRIQQTRQVYR